MQALHQPRVMLSRAAGPASCSPRCPGTSPHLPLPSRAPLPALSASSYHHSSYPAQEALEELSSLQNATVKHCVKVRTSRSYREGSGTVVIHGVDLLAELAGHTHVEALFFVRGAAIPDIDAGRMVAVTEAVMAKITGLDSVSQGTVAAEVRTPRPGDYRPSSGRLTRLLVLERCQDPGNMGTLLRTALALGWEGVFLLPGCCDPLNEKCLRASRGAAFKLPIVQGSLEEWGEVVREQGLACLAADPRARPVSSPADGEAAAAEAAGSYRAHLSGLRLCLCLGSEGQGLTPDVAERCTAIGIPMPGEMESLNVSVAGSILMMALSPGAPQLLADIMSL